ncbi:MAG: pyridoxal phosphate-dependent aminotransferase [Cyclobacteriaceae bacterium]|nr:MAG: pyridoxal phosphate-dependent aminotransferase [Cyclobacteriaceae bacterium]
MGGEERRFIEEAFSANWISPAGPHLRLFEEQLSNYLGIKACAALASGTAAIHLALLVLGVKPGEEVICSTFTFAGSCNPIVYVGAVPVLVDSEPYTWNMDPDLLEEAIVDRIRKTGKKPGAIIIVHLYGMPARLDRLISIAQAYEIPVIEDAAEALGSEWFGRKAGTFGDIGIFSFNGNKIITTSGGGALVSNNQNYVEKARFLATQARENALHYEHREVGYNYRLSNICAAIGLGQLKVLEERIAQRRKVFNWYKARLNNHFSFLNEPENVRSNRWITTPVVPGNNPEITVNRIIHALDKHNIESRPLWKPMHLQPVYRQVPAYTNGLSEKLFKGGFCLPSGSSLAVNQVERIAGICIEVVNN